MTSMNLRSPTVIRFSPKMLLGLGGLLVAPWLAVGVLAYRGAGSAAAVQSASTRPATTGADAHAATTTGGAAATTSATNASTTVVSADVTLSKDGPWGKMQLVPIALELPDEYAAVDLTVSLRDKWTFTGMTRDAAMAMMSACGLTNDQLAMARAATWTENITASSFEPPDALVLSLAPQTRATLYTKLMADEANKYYIDPSWFRVGRVDFRLRGSELSDRSISLLKQLLYPGPDETSLFNDIKPALRAIEDPAERSRFIRAVTRKRSLMARLIINADTNTDALAAYWGKGGREKTLVPVLDSLKFNVMAGVEVPSKINVASLLPPFVQERLYRHAESEQPAGRLPEDCFWTAFNFFSDTPDERVHDMNYLAGLLQSDYVKIDQPSQLGDLILIADEKGDAMHAANYIADDVVFTKNGFSFRQPWILAPMRDLISTYRIRNDKLTIAYFRKRNLPVAH